MSKKNYHGFTLIELLVVISIIGVLASLIVSNINSARERARDTKRKQGLQQMKTALRLYYNDFQQYPPDNFGRYLAVCGAGDDANCDQGDQFEVNDTIYMKSLPEYQYNLDDSDTDKYILKVILENTSDPDIPSSQTSCLGTPTNPLVSEYYVCED